MKSKPIIASFLSSVVAAPVLFAVVDGTGGPRAKTAYVEILFALTVLVEIAALAQAMTARKVFSRSDSGHLTWTLIVAFLIVRLLAELRLITLTFGLVAPPRAVDNAPPLLFFYVIVLRYVYTFSDALFVGALVSTVRSYKSTGLKFGLLGRDYLYIILLWVIPFTTFAFRANLGLTGFTGPDPYIPTYRLVAVIVGAVIASLCVVVRRFAVQMGGGAVARVWNTVVVAGIARDASFLALALLSPVWDAGARFGEQYLLWIFAGCWLMAAVYQQEVLVGVRRTPVLKEAKSEIAG